MIKARLRFIKLGEMQYIGHLDLMRYFQKLFRRSGLDISYSKGFNPHQIMSFASPLGVGLTSIGEYMDITLESIGEYTENEWIEIINSHSNGLVFITAFIIMPENIKPSMSLLSAASYMIDTSDSDAAADIEKFFNENDSIIYIKETKKSSKEIDLKKEIPVLASDYDTFSHMLSEIAVNDSEYEKKYIDTGKKGCIYMLCKAGSVLNIKPDMLFEVYQKEIDYQIMRLDMYSGEGRYVSMSVK